MPPNTVTAIHTFVAEHGDELEFSAGEQIEIIERDDAFGDGWWKGRNEKGEEGLFPATYISEDPDYVAPVGGAAAAPKTPNPDGTEEPADGSPIPVPASPNPQLSQVAAVSTPPTTASDKLASNNNNLSSPFSTAALAPENRNSLLDITGAPRGAAALAGVGAVGAAGAAAAGVAASHSAAPSTPGTNVMGSTIGQVQEAIDTMGSGSPAADKNGPAVPQGVQLRDPQEVSKAGRDVEDDDDDDEADGPQAIGIAHDARARLAEQARLANEERDRQAQRESGGVADLIYSDESDDEDDVSSHRGSNAFNRFHHNGAATTPTIDEAMESDLQANAGRQVDLTDDVEPFTSSSAKQADTSSLPAAPHAAVASGPITTAPVSATDAATGTATAAPETTLVNGGHLPQSTSAAPLEQRQATPEAAQPRTVSPARQDTAQDTAQDTTQGTAQDTRRDTSKDTSSSGVPWGGVAGVAGIGAGTAAIGAAMMSTSDSQTTLHAKSASPVAPETATLQSHSPNLPQPQQLADQPRQPSPRAGDSALLQPALPIAGTAVTPPAMQTPPTRHTPTLPAAAASPTVTSPVAPTPDLSRIPTTPPASWTVDEVVQWSRARGFDEVVSAKFVEHDISGDVLMELDANLLKELDIPQLGKRLRIASAINDLRSPASAVSSIKSQQQVQPQQQQSQSSPPLQQQQQQFQQQQPQQSPPAQHSPAPGSAPSLHNSSAGSVRSGTQPPSSFVGGATLAAAGAAAGAAGVAAAQSSTTPSGSPIVDDQHGWTHSRKVSVTPTTTSIDERSTEHQPKVFGANAPKSSSSNTNVNGSTNGHSTTRSVSSVPSTPATPSMQGIMKRESTGSLGHKKKGSVDKSDRLSFFGRNRKPPPGSPGTTERSSSSRLGFPGTKPAMTTMHADRPEKRVSSGPSATVGGALRTIGTPDKTGYLKKRGDRYNSWKTRFFVLKGSHLYYLKSESEAHVKGHIDLKGHRIVMDQSNAGSFGFRLVGPGSDKPHIFSSHDQTEIRDWMKSLMKATIQRDYAVPVTSSCNIPTIPLAEAQALQPRPPSPGERDATQRANRRENVNQLTPRDASVLMSLDTSGSGRRMTSHGSSLAVQPTQPARPSRDMRRPSADMRRPSTSTRSVGDPSVQSYYAPEPTEEQSDLLKWVNQVLPAQYPRAANFPNSFISGEVIFLLVKHLSGIEPNPPVPSAAFAPDANGMPNVEGLLAMGEVVIDAGVESAGVDLNEIRAGDTGAITHLLDSVRSWAKTKTSPVV